MRSGISSGGTPPPPPEEERQGLLYGGAGGPSTPSSSNTPSTTSTATTTTTMSKGRMSRAQKAVLLLLGIALLGYPFMADQIYLWMMTNELTAMLLPASRRSCGYEGLWVPFDDAVVVPRVANNKPSVAVVAVTDRRPDADVAAGSSSSTPAFKRLSNALMTQSLEQQQAYAAFWGYDHVLWEAHDPAHHAVLEGRPVAWGKLLALQEALETHEYALYLDLDLALVQPMLNLDGFIAKLESSGKDLLVSQDGNGVNTGVMLFRKSAWSAWFLQELWRVGASLVDCDCIFYYEQRAFHHALQTEQWQAGYKWWTRHIPLIGWFRNPLRGHPPGPTLEALPLRLPNGTGVASAEAMWAHVELAPQCAFNAVDGFTDAEFIVHFAGQKGRRKEKLMAHFGALAQQRLEKVALPLRNKLRETAVEGGGEGRGGPLPLVHQTWKTHVLEGHKQAWHMSWRRNGFQVQLRNDTECLADIERLCRVTGEPAFMQAYQLLNPVQRADFWRYAITWLDGGIYSDIDIGATPETARFFMERWTGPSGHAKEEEEEEEEETVLVGIIENAPYDNFWGWMHWKVGMSPMYSRLPQLRQSFFYARQGHPHLLRLMEAIRGMVMRWEESGHTDLGRPHPDLSGAQLKDMEASGALTLEMTGPGVWTDYMLTPLLAKRKKRTRKTTEEDQKEEAALAALRASSVILDTMEGYNIIRYGSMGSWKTDAHKADRRMWRNLLLFYSSPFLLAFALRVLKRRRRDAKRKAREASAAVRNGGGGGGVRGEDLGLVALSGSSLEMADRDKVH